MYQLKLSDSIVRDVRLHLDATVAPSLMPDVSSYAKGRRRAWLQTEPTLTKPIRLSPALKDARLWDWIQTVWQRAGMAGVPDLGLAIYGDIPITLHRDASYAAPQALSINLGGVTWLYDHDRGVSTPTAYTLNAGEVMRFNCKHRHGVADPQPDRWSIVVWQLSAVAKSPSLS